MSLILLTQSELSTLKQKAESILEELQMNCDFDYEDYHEALQQLTAIDGWTESQSTDGGYAEGHDRYAFQEQRVEEMKARYKAKKADLILFKKLIRLVFETDYMGRIQRNILDPDYVKDIYQKYYLSRADIFGNASSLQVFRNYARRAPSISILNLSAWELREILAWFKHHEYSSLETSIWTVLSGGYGLTCVHLNHVRWKLKQLMQLEHLEKVVTFGMLDLELINGPRDEFNHMLYNDFGKDVGINFKELRYQKAQAEKAELDAELKALMGIK